MNRDRHLVFWTALQTIFVGLAGTVAVYQLYLSDHDKQTQRVERTLKILDESNAPEIITRETQLKRMGLDAEIAEYQGNSDQSFREAVFEKTMERGSPINSILASASNCVQLAFCDEKLALQLFCGMHREHAELSDKMSQAYKFTKKTSAGSYDYQFGYYNPEDPNRGYFERKCPTPR